MKTLVYEIRRGCYELTKIRECEGEGLRFVFEEPIEAKLAIGEGIFSVRRGVCDIKLSEIFEGEIYPKLYCGTQLYKLEGFIFKNKEVIRLMPDADYIKSLGGICEQLSRKLALLEASVAEINKKIEQPLEF